jgi:outer membrane protein W
MKLKLRILTFSTALLFSIPLTAQIEKGSWIGTGGLNFTGNQHYYRTGYVGLSGGYFLKNNFAVGLYSDFTFSHAYGRTYFSTVAGPFARLYLTKSPQFKPYLDLKTGYRMVSWLSDVTIPGPPTHNLQFKGTAGFTWFPGKQKRIGIDVNIGLQNSMVLGLDRTYNHLSPAGSIGILWLFNRKR